MNQFLIYAIIFFAIIVFLVPASQQDIAPFIVIGRHDGDSIRVRDKDNKEFAIRFAVVDSNEDSNGLRQAGGKEATAYLHSILPIGAKVSLKFTGNESHNRSVATVYHRGENINLAMLKAGHAMIDPRYLKQIPKEMQKSYLDHQAWAKKQRLGRWSKKAWCAQTPWEFRETMRKK
jgi:endonuclease YncB( thermonuclease family)